MKMMNKKCEHASISSLSYNIRLIPPLRKPGRLGYSHLTRLIMIDPSLIPSHETHFPDSEEEPRTLPNKMFDDGNA